MPLIEELPVTTTIKASHGWAYVPDTGPIIAQQPGTRDRKRAAVISTKQTASATAKQQKAVQARLTSLNKENYKDGVTVPIPTKMGSSAREQAGRKMTSNVRRILTYQRGFAHYLADEEANNPGGVHYQLPPLLAAMGPPSVPTHAATSATTEPKSQPTRARDLGRRRSGVSKPRSTTNENSAPGTPTPATTTQSRGKKRGRPSSRAKLDPEDAATPFESEAQASIKPEDEDVTMIDATITSQADQDQIEPEKDLLQDYPPDWDNDPLLCTTVDDVPRMPSEKIMQLLMSEPPLTYNAARATPLEPEQQRPARHFCGVCGYWGKVKCRKCEDWTCGIMECWRAHEGVCVAANVY